MSEPRRGARALTRRGKPAAYDPQRHRGPWWLVLRLIVALVGLWLIAPVLVVIPMSLTNQRSYRFPPPGWSSRWYEGFFTDDVWLESLRISLVIGVLVALLATVLGTAAAFGLVRGRFPGRTLVLGLLLSPMIVPVVIVAIGVYLVFLRWKLVGTTFGFVVAHLILALPFVIVTVRASLQSFDITLERAAASLGARPFAVFREITLPLIAPGVVTGALFAFITSFDELVISIFLVDPDTRTLPVQMFTSVVRESDPSVAVAATIMLVITTAILTVVAVVGGRMRERVK